MTGNNKPLPPLPEYKAPALSDGGPPLTNTQPPDWWLRTKQSLEAIRANVANLAGAVGPRALTPSQLAQIQTAMQATGSNPINVTGLPGKLLQIQAAVLYGTHAQRVAAKPGANKGYLWVETDRNQGLFYSTGGSWVLIEQTGYGTFETRWNDLNMADAGAQYYETARNSVASIAAYPLYRWSGAAWVFVDGMFARNQNAIATLTATLGASDVGAQVRVIDFNHLLQWNGNNYGWAPGDPGSGWMQLFEVDPSPTVGWALYDGSNNVSYLQSNGNVATVNLPDLTSNNNAAAYPKAGSPNSGPNNAVAPSFNLNVAANNFTPTGNVSANFTGDALSPHTHESPVGSNGVTVFMTDFFGTVTSRTANYSMTTAASGTSFLTRSTGATSGGTPSGNIDATFVGDPLAMNGSVTGNINADGEPRNIVRRPWFRR